MTLCKECQIKTLYNYITTFVHSSQYKSKNFLKKNKEIKQAEDEILQKDILNINLTNNKNDMICILF